MEKEDKQNGGKYRDLIAAYVDHNFGPRDITVYTEVSVGKTIIGKNRRLDVLLVRETDQRSLAIECKWQSVGGTTDEKIPYALQDIEAMWIPGCLAYAGDGWSEGVLHTLEGSRYAVACWPDLTLRRRQHTLELDHVIAAVFGFFDLVIPPKCRFKKPAQLGLALPGPKKVGAQLDQKKRSKG